MQTALKIPADWRAEFPLLESAEEYCHFFQIDFDKAVLGRNRLAILKRFHDLMPANWNELEFADLRASFALAYAEMLQSNAREQELFKVFKKPVYTISISAIGGRKAAA